MTGYSNNITYNSVVLNITGMNANKVTKTVKQKMGKSLIEITTIGSGNKQWELDVTGVISGTTLANVDTNRSALVALDVASSYAYVDGVHDGNYFMKPGTLRFTDDGGSAQSYSQYSMTLIEA